MIGLCRDGDNRDDVMQRPREVMFMRAFGRSISSAFVAGAATLVLWPGMAPGVDARTDTAASLTGGWMLNKDLSDTPQNQTGDDRAGGARGRSGGGRGFGRGGFGGGAGRGGGRSGSDPEQAMRLRIAMRDLINPSDRLTIVQTDSIIITGTDGRTTRLSPDGKKVKDDSTKFEWKTKWDGARLVTEITGLPSGKILETIAVDPEQNQLHLTLQVEDKRRSATLNRVYDFDPR